MTPEEIIELAEKSGVAFSSDEYPDIWQTYMHVGKKELEAFAKLIAEKEREACAKFCDDRVIAYQYATDVWAQEHIDEARHLAKAIRARGQA